jgi:hypothetical protein
LLVLPLSLLMMLGVFRVTGGLKNAEHRTDAVLALLARGFMLVTNFLGKLMTFNAKITHLGDVPGSR